MKRKYILAVFIFLLIVVAGFAIFTNKTFSAGTTTYADWSSLSKIDNIYSYSTVFLTQDTQFRILRNDGVNDPRRVSGIDKDFPRISDLKPGDQFLMLITNCGVDRNDDLMDVLIKVDNIQSFNAGYTPEVRFRVITDYTLPKSQNDPSNYTIYNMKLNQPLMFYFYTSYAQADFTMTYYKAGTYSSSSNTGTLANIQAVNGVYWDFDIPGYLSSKFLGGNEGFVPKVGTTKIIYNKNKKGDAYYGGYQYSLQEIDNGIAVEHASGLDLNEQVFWWPTSALALTTGLNSIFSFTYGGSSCGLRYMFASPYPFEIEAPKKTADKTEVKTGEGFEYTISQYVPNNYFGTEFTLNEIYKNLYKNSRYSNFKITDTLDSHLTINQSGIKVLNETNSDVTNYFSINVVGNTVTATVNAATLNNVDFYAHTYKLKIPVTVKSDTYGVDKVPNKATTTSTICRNDNDCPTENKDTNNVDVKMKYNLTVNYIEGSTKNVIAPKDVSDSIYYYDDDYKTNYNKVDLKMWRIDKSEVEVGEGKEKDQDSKIIEGKIKGNTIVNYYFEKREYPVTVNYYDAQTKEKIAESDKTIYYYTMNYYTNYDKIDRDVWEYVSTDGDPVEGVIDGEQESYTINYYFNRLKYRLLVNYYDNKTKAKIAKGDRYTYNYEDEYETNYDKIDPEYWEYVITEGTTPGIIYEDTEVDYYFKNNEYTIEVNFYDEETGEKIDDPDISSHKYDEEYKTNDDKIDKNKWELVEVPENAEGRVHGDIEVNYYYRKRKYKITVNYYEKGTDKKVAESSEIVVYYGDKYVTDYGVVDGRIWKLVGMPDNYQGEVTGDIEVNYYFKRVSGTGSSNPNINNPQTGSSQNILIIEITTLISMLLVVIITIYKIYLKKKIYKL